MNLPKVNVPPINMNKYDWSKLNLRKFNWLTVIGVLSYLNILVLISFFLRKKKPYFDFHARQGLALLAVWAIFPFTLYIPFLPWLFVIFIILCMSVGIYDAVTGKEIPLPIIGNIAKQEDQI